MYHLDTSAFTLPLLKMAGLSVQREFVSIGVNRVVNALDWGQDGRVAYGGHHQVVIYDPEVDATEKRSGI